MKTLLKALFAATVLGALVAGCGGGGGGGSTPAPAPPSTIVTSTSPATSATGVATNTSFAITFSAPVNETSVTNAFTLTSSAGPVTGTFNYYGKAAVFTPTNPAPLNSSITYTATLDNTATDSSGRKLVGNQPNGDSVWFFTTGTTTDVSEPQVLGVTPIDKATDVPRDTEITVIFDEAVNPNITGNIDGHPTDVTVDYITNTVTMKPANPLQANTEYPFIIQVRDLSGNLMALPFSWSFTTGN